MRRDSVRTNETRHDIYLNRAELHEAVLEYVERRLAKEGETLPPASAHVAFTEDADGKTRGTVWWTEIFNDA